MINEDVERELYKLQQHQEQIEDIYAQIELIERLIKDYERTVDTLIEIEKMEGEREAMLPIGGNLFLYATIKDTRKVVARVGGKVMIEKSVNRAIDFVNKRIEELKRSEESLIKTANDIREKMEEISKKLRDKNVQIS
ncbi:MAG: prefoldin subunit alpha [Thermoplasmata archaeon]|nr:prefoldin subunit alpha [Thermoplasmata archaeon]